MSRELKGFQAIREATEQCLEADPQVYLMGLGVPDPKGLFGTTQGLAERYGNRRVLDMPVSENAMTGIAIGSAVAGMRPILTHQRVDFALLSLDQLINNAAKWRAMFGGRMHVPLVVRMIIGRGWGQGPQHSQGLQALFAHIPGLKVVAPATPHDAKGLLVAAVEDDDPVIYLEHRWIHGISGPVPKERYSVPIGAARIARPGRDLTLVASSFLVLEALKAADFLAQEGIDTEVVDLRTLRPLDVPCVVDSVRRTGHLLAADHGWRHFGVAGEIVAQVAEKAFANLRRAPLRVTLPDAPVPTSPALAEAYYPRAADLVAAVRRMLERPAGPLPEPPAGSRSDAPDPTFTGPF